MSERVNNLKELKNRVKDIAYHFGLIFRLFNMTLYFADVGRETNPEISDIVYIITDLIDKLLSNPRENSADYGPITVQYKDKVATVRLSIEYNLIEGGDTVYSWETSEF